MMVKCLSLESWDDVVNGSACTLLIEGRVPYGMRFMAYVGQRPLPAFVDGRNKFVSLGCAKYGRGKYICKVRVERPKSV